jgi:hypothetical protein
LKPAAGGASGSAALANLLSVGLSLFAHAFEPGLLLLGHELAAFLVPLREGLLGFFTAPLRALSPTGLFVAMTCSSPLWLWVGFSERL